MKLQVMFKILEKINLNEYVGHMTILAPMVAKNARPGQFLILRIDELGERIPLTIFKSNKSEGTIEIIYQKVGTSTYKLDSKEKGEYILDVVGPLGRASNLSRYKKAILVSGGVGAAIAYPMAKGLFDEGCLTDTIMGFRSAELIILEEELMEVSQSVDVTTDDGSNGTKGFVTDILTKKLEESSDYDVIFAVGPIPMMKAVCNIAKNYDIKTVVSMTAIMIDGTGMCGGCRIKVGGKTKFACVDGPDFDGNEVDFDDAIVRMNMFKSQEKHSCEKYCNLFKGV